MTIVPPTPARSPWQGLYRAAHAWRRRRAAVRARRLPRPVVSLGNLHWGGTGKTPLVAAVGRHLAASGRQVAVLTRGYGGTARAPLVLSRGGGPLASPEGAGDEPVELARTLPGVAIVVGRDRFAAGELALAELSPAPDLFLLDDGFSHVALARDLDLLAVPRADPYGGGRLPPSGRLREPLESARHAHALLVTGAAATADDAREIAAGLRPFGFAGEAFAAPSLCGQLRGVSGGAAPAADAKVLLVAGIARPERFAAAAAAAGLTIGGHLFFPDHHAYPSRSLQLIERTAIACQAAAVVTTAKDETKLAGRLQQPLAVLPVRAEPEAAFWAWLDARLAALVEGLSR